jgi:hypothetical protein
MKAEIKLSSPTALQICTALGMLLRSNEIPKADKDNIFKMFEGIKQFTTKEDFDKYVRTMKYIDNNKHLIGALSELLNTDFDNTYP